MLILIRHALSEANLHNYRKKKEAAALKKQFNEKTFPTTDPDITPVGHEQAAEAGRFFKQWMEDTGTVPDKIVISPFLRTIHTASIFLKEAGLEGKTVILEPMIREHMDGSKSNMGTAKKELLQMLEDSKHLLQDWNVDTSLMTEEIWYHTVFENDNELQQRLQDIRDRYIDGPDKKEVILAVSHGGIGLRLAQWAGVDNCEIIKYEKDTAAQSLFRPSKGPHNEPLIGQAPDPKP